MPHATCTMHNPIAPCNMHHAPCTMQHAPCAAAACSLSVYATRPKVQDHVWDSGAWS